MGTRSPRWKPSHVTNMPNYLVEVISLLQSSPSFSILNLGILKCQIPVQSFLAASCDSQPLLNVISCFWMHQEEKNEGRYRNEPSVPSESPHTRSEAELCQCTRRRVEGTWEPHITMHRPSLPGTSFRERPNAISMQRSPSRLYKGQFGFSLVSMEGIEN